MNTPKRPHIVEHRLFGPMPRWCSARIMRGCNLLVALSMLVGFLAFFSLIWSDRWFPTWAYVAGTFALLLGAVYGTVYFVSLMVFQWYVKKMPRQSS